MPTERGKFIVLDGLDGSGKTTQAGLLARFLEFQGREVVSTREPTDESDAGKIIKKVLMREEMCPPTKLQELFAEDRRAHLDTVILPALDGGKIVISDRYFLSSIAFGSIGCDLEWLIGLYAGFPIPDITFILNVSPEHCIERIYSHKRDIKLFERPEALKKAWETYQKLPGRFPNIHIIDGERPIDPIFEEIKEKIAALL